MPLAHLKGKYCINKAKIVSNVMEFILFLSEKGCRYKKNGHFCTKLDKTFFNLFAIKIAIVARSGLHQPRTAAIFFNQLNTQVFPAFFYERIIPS